MRMRRSLPVVVACLLPAILASSAVAAPTITEFSAGNGPVGVTRGPDSNVWFTDLPNPGQIGRITQSGVVSTFGTLAGLENDAKPTGITAGPGGLWFTENGKDRIGRITTGGSITEFPDGSHNGPSGIAAGPDGNLWYTA